MKKILMTLTLALAAAIAIPAAAQTETTTQPVKECCKEKKGCSKEEGKACCKADSKKDCDKAQGKACCKEGKDGKIKVKDLKKTRGQRMAGDAKEMGRVRRSAENPMFKGITLTEDQQQKINAIREKSKAAEKKSKAEMKERSRAEMHMLRAEFDKEVEKILDKDQLKQYQANKAELEAKRAAKGKKK